MQRLDAIQGLRAIAAWFVVMAHGALWIGGFGSLGLPVRSYEMLGSLGVLMFFAVSGFVMAYISQGDADRSGSLFLQRRLIRVVPLYWLMTLFTVVIIVRHGETLGLAHLAKSLMFIPDADEGPLARPVLGVGWTLNYEMFFYALFTATLLLRRGLPLLCGVMAGLLLIGQILNPVWHYHDPATIIGTWTDPLLLPFLLGIGMAMLRDARPELRISQPFLLLGAGSLGVLLLQAAFIAQGSYPAWWRIAVLVLSGLLASFAIFARPDVKMPRWLVLAGDASYSLYLVHPLLFGVARRFGGDTLAHWLPIAGLAFYVLLSTAAGVTLHIVVERPVTRWLGRRTSGLREARARAPAAA